MKRNELIAARLKEVLLNGHWVANTNYQEQLQGVTWDQAIQKIGCLNTIAALTFHINYYLGGLLNAFDNGILDIHDKYSFDLPEIKSEHEWQMLKRDLLENAEQFVERVEKMNESKLDQPFIVEKYGTYQRNIEGVIEHCYYHLGQISMIRKMISSNN